MIFAKEKIFFKENQSFYLIDIQLFINSLRARAFHIRKKAVFGTFQNFFLKKFCSSEKRFYNSHVLESQTNGKQVRRKTNKKIDSKKTELKNRKAKTAESEKQKALFVGNLFLRLGKSKIRLFALERLNRVLNNHTEQDYKPM